MAAGGHRILDVVEINPYAPRPHAFTESALCLRDAIRRAGWDSEHRFNQRDAARPCIVMGAVPPRLDAVAAFDPATTVIFNFEQLGTGSYNDHSPFIDWLRRWPVVADYHSANIEWLARRGIDAVELPIVPSLGIAWRPDLAHEPVNDVVFFGTPNPRRERLVGELREAGLTVEWVVGAFGEELAPALKRARIVLNVHFYEAALFPIARFLQAIALGLPCVCEDSVFSRRTGAAKSGIVFAPYGELVDACRDVLADPASWPARVDAMRRWAGRIEFAGALETVSRRLQSAPSAAPGEERLTNDEIERLLLEDESALPPEGEHVQPFKLVERTPGKGRYGVWIVVLMLVFSFYTIWVSMVQR
ncbi:MAG TPA: hypothetical protein VMZ74_13160 [Ramlibacter sp.]|nr:hypothetical protein [Ramlibacter sp.]